MDVIFVTDSADVRKPAAVRHWRCNDKTWPCVQVNQDLPNNDVCDVLI